MGTESTTLVRRLLSRAKLDRVAAAPGEGFPHSRGTPAREACFARQGLPQLGRWACGRGARLQLRTNPSRRNSRRVARTTTLSGYGFRSLTKLTITPPGPALRATGEVSVLDQARFAAGATATGALASLGRRSGSLDHSLAMCCAKLGYRPRCRGRCQISSFRRGPLS